MSSSIGDGVIRRHGSSVGRRRAEELDDLVNGRPENVAQALPELAALLSDPGDDSTLRAVIVALGHAVDDRAVQLLVDADLGAHDDEQVRLVLAQALAAAGLPGPAARDAAIGLLLRLSGDPIAKVRDWACFGLGSLQAAGPVVQDALAARLDDPDDQTRDEALKALAATGDERALARTAQVLASPSEQGVMLLHLQAALELASPELLPVLQKLALEWEGDDDEHTELLGRALRRSAPDASRRAADLEQQLVVGLNERLAGQGRAVYLTGGYPRTTLHFNDENPQAGWWRRLWDDDDPDTFDIGLELASWATSRS
ncbi:MAG: HEAT repeat domain-containing protein [Motilibacteraceae bacterium]